MSGVGNGQNIKTNASPNERVSGDGYWDPPANAKGERCIVLDLCKQKIFYYIGTQLVGISPMSSGKEGFGTPKGEYKIIQKEIDYKSGTYGVLRDKATNEILDDDFSPKQKAVPAGAYYDPAPMPYFMRIHGGYGMHVGMVLGYPVSHGCVRLPENMAKAFFNNTPLGTKVIIQ